MGNFRNEIFDLDYDITFDLVRDCAVRQLSVFEGEFSFMIIFMLGTFYIALVLHFIIWLCNSYSFKSLEVMYI